MKELTFLQRYNVALINITKISTIKILENENCKKMVSVLFLLSFYLMATFGENEILDWFGEVTFFCYMA